MKVVHLNTSTSWGGLEQYTSLHIQALAQRGVDTVALVIHGSRLQQELSQAGIRTIDARRRSYLSISDVRAIRKELSVPGAVVHSHTRVDVWNGSWSVHHSKAPHVNSVYMIAVDKHDVLHRHIYGNVDAIVCTSETNIAAISKNYPIPTERIKLVRYMRSPKRYSRNAALRAAFRDSWGATEDTIVVGLMCRIDPQKGVREFVEALSLLPQDIHRQVLFVVVGEPSIAAVNADGATVFEPASAELFTWMQGIAPSQPNLRVVSFQDDVSGVLSALDVFVLATRGEMYALSVIEAMMVGLPVIGTNSGGTPDQLQDERGMLVEPGSAHAIAEAVATYVQEPGIRALHAQRGKQWAVAQHDPDVAMQQWMELYAEVLA